MIGRAGRWLRAAAPVAITALLALATTAPLHGPLNLSLTPNLALMSVFYWTVYRPGLLPGWSILTIGLLQDLATGGPLGLSAMTLLAAFGLALNQRRLFPGKPFAIAWWAFAMIAVVATAASWAIVSLLGGAWLSVRQPLSQLAITVTLFPSLAALFARIQRSLEPQPA